MTAVKTFSGLQFEVRREGANDMALVADFWRHVSRTNLPARYVGVVDPSDPEACASQAHEGRTSTFLAFGGDKAIICIAMLVSDVEHRSARVMAFTRDGITSHGVSWALLEYVLAEAQKDGILAVTSVLSLEDAPAVRLERKMGFVEADYPGNASYRLLRWTFGERVGATAPFAPEGWS